MHSESTSDLDIVQYLHGDCHLFAYALNVVFDYPIELCIDSEDMETQSEVLVHAYCKLDNKFIDVRGISNDIEHLLSEFDYNTIQFFKVDKNHIEKLIVNKALHGFEKNQLEKLMDYIRTNKDKYII